MPFCRTGLAILQFNEKSHSMAVAHLGFCDFICGCYGPKRCNEAIPCATLTSPLIEKIDSKNLSSYILEPMVMPQVLAGII